MYLSRETTEEEEEEEVARTKLCRLHTILGHYQSLTLATAALHSAHC